MKKVLGLALAAAFAVGLGIGYQATPAEAAEGGGGVGCTYYCDCAGTPMKCCPTPWGVFCFETDEFACTQGYDC
jgi:hypothetical protein